MNLDKIREEQARMPISREQLALARETGQMLAWELADGNVMAGTIDRDWPWLWDFRPDARIRIRRVDGTICSVPQKKLRVATYEESMAAIRFFSEIGK